MIELLRNHGLSMHEHARTMLLTAIAHDQFKVFRCLLQIGYQAYDYDKNHRARYPNFFGWARSQAGNCNSAETSDCIGLLPSREDDIPLTNIAIQHLAIPYIRELLRYGYLPSENATLGYQGNFVTSGKRVYNDLKRIDRIIEVLASPQEQLTRWLLVRGIPKNLLAHTYEIWRNPGDPTARQEIAASLLPSRGYTGMTESQKTEVLTWLENSVNLFGPLLFALINNHTSIAPAIDQYGARLRGLAINDTTHVHNAPLSADSDKLSTCNNAYTATTITDLFIAAAAYNNVEILDILFKHFSLSLNTPEPLIDPAKFINETIPELGEVAIINGNYEIIEFLLRHYKAQNNQSFDLNQLIISENMVWIAIMHNHTEIFARLLITISKAAKSWRDQRIAAIIQRLNSYLHTPSIHSTTRWETLINLRRALTRPYQLYTQVQSAPGWYLPYVVIPSGIVCIILEHVMYAYMSSSQHSNTNI